MKKAYLYLFVILLVSCSILPKGERDRASPDLVAERLSEGQGRYYFDTTYTKNDQLFRVSTRELSEEFVVLTASQNARAALTDTLSSLGLSDMEFPDFNKDGYPDIMLTYLGNNSTYFLYLFDSHSGRFRKVDGFDKFPEAIQLKADPALYYSYRRAGCADMNWVSNLFKIEHFKAIHLGQIHGQGCDRDEAPQVIEFFKIQDQHTGEKELMERLPYAEAIPDIGDKWAFIAQYWNEKYQLFK